MNGRERRAKIRKAIKKRKPREIAPSHMEKIAALRVRLMLLKRAGGQGTIQIGNSILFLSQNMRVYVKDRQGIREDPIDQPGRNTFKFENRLIRKTKKDGKIGLEIVKQEERR